MKKNKIKHIIIYLFIFLIIAIALLFSILQKEKQQNNNLKKFDNIIIVGEPITVKEVIERHDSIYLSETDDSIYVNFNKDLFEKNGNSNEEFFKSIVNDLKPFLKKDTYLIDEEKNIKIKIDFENLKLVINDNRNFYEETDGKDYINVDTVKTVDKTNMYVQTDELFDLVTNGMYINDDVLQSFGTEDELQMQEDYISYNNSALYVSKYKFSNRIRHIIYSKEYEKEIMSNIKVGDSLQEIYKYYPRVAFGSVEEGYLGYRTDDVYIFCYKDEFSVYGYSYVTNYDFEEYLEDYLNTKDLALFKKRMLVTHDNYYAYNYDEENQNLYLSYPTMGIEIDIKNNNPKGIKLYKNYCFSDDTKEFVKNGSISLEADIDYLEKIEKERVSK